MKLAWLTDIHLNFLEEDALATFCADLAGLECDAFLIGGDIGEAPNVCRFLTQLGNTLQRPIYFVLGNHDFYRGSIVGVRTNVTALGAICPNLHWMGKAGIVPLTEQTCLVGVDGWGDGRHGDFWGSEVLLNDWGLIAEFGGFFEDQGARLTKLQALGDEAADHLRTVLPEALARYHHIVVLTHVPPFREACWHQGQISSADWLPHFTCKAVGDVLREAMAAHPNRQMTVLCGHTHGEGEARVLANLRVLTGGAVYGRPKVQRVLEIE